MEAPSASSRLDGWKAIAAYLGRDERTAQRWRQRGLPVHAVPGGKRGAAFAYTYEIDEWLTRREPADVKEEAAGAPAETRPPDVPPIRVEPQRVGPTRSWMWLRSKPVWLGLLSGALLIALVVASASAWKPAGRSRVVRAEVINNLLLAWTADGQVAFTVNRSELIPPDIASSGVQRVLADTAPIIDDFDGDGSPDVLVVLGFHSDRLVASHEVVRYSDTGVLKWRYRPQRRLRFGTREFDGPWRIEDQLVTRDADGRLRIFLAVIHDVWWPSFIVSLDAAGTERLHHVNSGHLYKLQHLQAPAGDRLLATGINNEYKSALLTAIDIGAPPTVSPQIDAAFTCNGCTGEPPPTYLLFPQTELSQVHGRPYNFGAMLVVTPSEVRVSTMEMPDGGVRCHYRLSRALELQSVGMSDIYWSMHPQLEQKGELSHPGVHCEDAKRRPVRVWTKDGWRETWVPGEGSH
jgi:hypothetical protein